MPIPAEVESLIADASVSAHLATAKDNRPHVAPVWYGYQDGVVSFITGGKKLRNIQSNPQVALSLEKASTDSVEWNVTLLGTATIYDDEARIAAASDWIYDAYDDDDTASDDSNEEAQPDDGDEDANEYEYALVRVEIGSASWTIYD